MSDTNGNGHSNGNGHQKVFELARVKSPEELQMESARKTAPEIRTAVSFTKLPMAAKGFFSALLDLSFLHCFGGNGRGKIFITVRDLSRLLKHDKDSISEWRRILVTAGVLWYQEGWPRSEWRICALCPAPNTDFQFSEEHFIVGKAAALEAVGSLPPATFSAPNIDSPRETEDSRQSEPENSPQLSDTFRHTVRNLPPREGSPSAPPGESSSHNGGILSDSVAETFRTNKETPKEKGSQGDQECVPGTPHTPALKFDPLDLRMVSRLRRTHGKDMIERLKEKRFALENSRKPPANRKATVDAISRRIRDIKDWMDGIHQEETTTK
jgi:hypothetical protein